MLTSSQFEQLQQVCMTIVWVTFNRRDEDLIKEEVTRFFKGPLGLYYATNDEEAGSVPAELYVSN